jgi:hypothetical protein
MDGFANHAAHPGGGGGICFIGERALSFRLFGKVRRYDKENS